MSTRVPQRSDHHPSPSRPSRQPGHHGQSTHADGANLLPLTVPSNPFAPAAAAPLPKRVSLTYAVSAQDACSHCFGTRVVMEVSKRVSTLLQTIHVGRGDLTASPMKKHTGSPNTLLGLSTTSTASEPSNSSSLLQHPLETSGTRFSSEANSYGDFSTTDPSTAQLKTVAELEKSASCRGGPTSIKPNAVAASSTPGNVVLLPSPPRRTAGAKHAHSSLQAPTGTTTTSSCSLMVHGQPLERSAGALKGTSPRTADLTLGKLATPTTGDTSGCGPNSFEQDTAPEVVKALCSKSLNSVMQTTNGWRTQDLQRLLAYFLDEWEQIQAASLYRLEDPCSCTNVAVEERQTTEPCAAAQAAQAVVRDKSPEALQCQPPVAPPDAAAAPRRRLISFEARADSLPLRPEGHDTSVTSQDTSGSPLSPHDSIGSGPFPGLPSPTHRTETSVSPTARVSGTESSPPLPVASNSKTSKRAKSVIFTADVDAPPDLLLPQEHLEDGLDDGVHDSTDTPVERRGTLDARRSLVVSDSATRDTDELSGFEMVNQYLILDQIGAGASGVVFAVHDMGNSAEFAMKVVKKERFQRRRASIIVGDDATESLSGSSSTAVSREVAIMKKLRHPHVVKLHEVIDDASHNKLYLVMQLLTGGRLCPSLDPATGECEPVEPQRLRKYVYQICDGLRYLHQHNIIHRDVKPENMMLDANDNVVLVDFGVSEVALDDEGLVEGAIGTPAFMAPEVWNGDRVCGAAADVWSLGVSVFMMLTGRSPFLAKTKDALIEQVRMRDPEFPEGVDPAWRALLRGMLSKNAATRVSLSAIMRNELFADYRPSGVDGAVGGRVTAGLRGAIVVTDEDLQGAIADRADVTVTVMCDDDASFESAEGMRHSPPIGSSGSMCLGTSNEVAPPKAFYVSDEKVERALGRRIA